MGKRKGPEARRATISRDRASEYRYHVQAGNWQIIDAPEEGFAQKRTVLARIARRWPDCAEIIDNT